MQRGLLTRHGARCLRNFWSVFCIPRVHAKGEDPEVHGDVTDVPIEACGSQLGGLAVNVGGAPGVGENPPPK